jgi:hypothetical protein
MNNDNNNSNMNMNMITMAMGRMFDNHNNNGTLENKGLNLSAQTDYK